MDRMDRRHFLKIAGAAAAVPKEAFAQTGESNDEETFDLSAFTYPEPGTPKERLALQRELVEHILTQQKAGKIKANEGPLREGLYDFDFGDLGLLSVGLPNDPNDFDSVQIYFYLPAAKRQLKPENESWIVRGSSIDNDGRVGFRANLATSHINIKHDVKKETRYNLWEREFYGAIQMILARG